MGRCGPRRATKERDTPVLAPSNAGVYLAGALPRLSVTPRRNPDDSGIETPPLAPVWNAATRKHYRAAVRLKTRAEQLYADDELEAAAELLYMAAKRAINAVANSRSRNPISTRAKYRQLKRIAQTEPDGAQLLTLWNAAWRLHTYADQMPESATLEPDWQRTLEFIAGMLGLLPSNGAPDSEEQV